MNEFVNLGKRGVDLPPGCRDLIDVLCHAKWPLAHVARHLPKLLEPGTKSKNLVITWGEMNYVHLMNKAGIITALTVIHEDTDREGAVREVFKAAGLVPTHDEAAAGWPIRLLMYPLPAGESTIRELVSDLLRKGYGLAETVRLHIGSWEDDAS